MASATTTHEAEVTTHNILTIPAEICERTAQLALPWDLLNLRRVCKEADARVFRTFGQTWFSHKAYLTCANESLAVFSKITSIAPLARFLQNIAFCVDVYPDPDCYSIPYPRSDLREIAPIEHSGQLTFLRRIQSQTLRARYEGQKDKQLDELRLHLLLRAFCQLRESGICPTIEITTEKELESARLCKYEELCNQTGVQLVVHERGVVQQTTILFDALGLSALRPRGLEVRIDGIGLPFYELARDETRFVRLKSAFPNLQRLELEMDTYGEHKVDQTHRLIDAMKYSTTLREVILYWDSPYMHLHEAFLSHTFPAATRIQLGNRSFAYGDIVNFVHLQPKLQLLELLYCDIQLDHKYAYLARVPHCKVERDLERRGAIRTFDIAQSMVGGGWDTGKDGDEESEVEENWGGSIGGGP